MSLERIWAGWRNAYVSGVANVEPVPGECVFCSVFSADVTDRERLVVHRGKTCVVMLNLFPYGSGHLLLMPTRHLARLDELEPDEHEELFQLLVEASTTLEKVYGPDGMNVGANFGRAGGAGVPGHLHLHALPRWAGDTNFVTTVGEARIINEDLITTYDKVHAAWTR